MIKNHNAMNVRSNGRDFCILKKKYKNTNLEMKHYLIMHTHKHNQCIY